MTQLQFLITTLALAATPAWADWTFYGLSAGEDETFIFIDYSTIVKDGTTRKVWVLWNYSKPQAIGEISTQWRFEYDCKEKRSRWLSTLSTEGSGGTGKILDSSDSGGSWKALPPGSVGAGTLRAVCAR